MAATAALDSGGLLAFHDSFLPDGLSTPAAVALGSLARRMNRDGCRDWSIDRIRDVLRALGLTDVNWQPLPAGTMLVTAKKL